jgi:hypothetical protein
MVPYCVTIALTKSQYLVSLSALGLDEPTRVILRTLEVLSLVRILRFYADSPSVLFVIKAIARVLSALLVPLLAFVLFNLAAAPFYFYSEPCYDVSTCSFPDLFSAFYYSVTITTRVGYPSLESKSFAGRVLAGASMPVGWLLLGVSLAVIGNEYSYVVEEFYESSISAAQAAVLQKQREEQRRQLARDPQAFKSVASLLSLSPSEVERVSVANSKLVALLRAARSHCARISRAATPNRNDNAPALLVTPFILSTVAQAQAALSLASFEARTTLDTVTAREAKMTAATDAVGHFSLSAYGGHGAASFSGGLGWGRGGDEDLQGTGGAVQGGEEQREEEEEVEEAASSAPPTRGQKIRRRHAKLPLFRRMFGMLQEAQNKMKRDKDRQAGAETAGNDEEGEASSSSAVAAGGGKGRKPALGAILEEESPQDPHALSDNGEEDEEEEYNSEEDEEDEEDEDEAGGGAALALFQASAWTAYADQIWLQLRLLLQAASAVAREVATYAPASRAEYKTQRLKKVAANPHLLQNRLFLVLHVPQSSLQAWVYRRGHFIVFFMVVALLMAETVPSVMQTGPSSLVCGVVLKNYCADKGSAVTDPGCFVGPLQGGTRPLRFGCSGSDCFAQGNNFGGSLPSSTASCSSLFSTQAQLDFLYGNHGAPTLVTPRPSATADQRFALCARSECTARSVSVTTTNSAASAAVGAAAAKYFNVGQWFEFAEGITFALWAGDTFMYMLAHESWAAYLCDLGSYCDLLAVLPFFAPFALRDLRALYYAYGTGTSGVGAINNLPWFFILPTLVPTGVVGGVGLSVIQCFKLFKMVRVWRLSTATELFSKVATAAVPQVACLVGAGALLSLLCGMLSYELDGAAGTFGNPSGYRLEGNHGAFESILQAWFYGAFTIYGLGCGVNVPSSHAGMALGIVWLILGTVFTALAVAAVATTYSTVAAAEGVGGAGASASARERDKQRHERVQALVTRLNSAAFAPIYTDPLRRADAQKLVELLDATSVRLAAWAEALRCGPSVRTSPELKPTPLAALAKITRALVQGLATREADVYSLVVQSLASETFEQSLYSIGSARAKLLLGENSVDV